MKIKELRVSQGKTQKEVADYLNVSQVTYGRYELSLTEPTIDSIVKLADYFNVSLDYLLERQYNNQIGYIPDDKKEVVRLILQLNEINTIKLFGYASGLLAGQN